MATPAAAAPAKRKTPWTIVYPVYFNARRTVAEGRRLPTNKSVDNPTVNEIVEVCKKLGLTAELDADKAYPRDTVHPGRVRVRILNEDGKPSVATITNSALPTKETKLLLALAAEFPKLPNRANSAQPAAASQPSGKKGKKGK